MNGCRLRALALMPKRKMFVYQILGIGVLMSCVYLWSSVEYANCQKWGVCPGRTLQLCDVKRRACELLCVR